MITLQKLQKTSQDSFENAEKYFRILSGLNNLGLTKTQISFISFVATRGMENKKEFYQIFNVSNFSVNNLVRQLKKKGLLVKEDKKIVLPKALRIDFSNSLVLKITLDVAETN